MERSQRHRPCLYSPICYSLSLFGLKSFWLLVTLLVTVVASVSVQGAEYYLSDRPLPGAAKDETLPVDAALEAPKKEEQPIILRGVKPGDTIEVHWVYSSCDVSPGKTLGACLSDACVNPQLRVETQVFLGGDQHRGDPFLQPRSRVRPGIGAQDGHDLVVVVVRDDLVLTRVRPVQLVE